MNLPKLSRRQMLLAGLGLGASTQISLGEWRRRERQQEREVLEAIAESQLDTEALLEQSFRADLDGIEALHNIRQSVTLTTPQLPYNRELSNLLIQANKLATQQYQKGRIDSDYDGSIASLPAYTEAFQGFTQVAAFKGTEVIKQDVPVDLTDNAIPPEMHDQVVDQVDQVESALEEIVSIRRRVSVFYGFLLASEQASILVFRGTQQLSDWLSNILLNQVPFPAPGVDEAEAEDAAAPLGRVHSGFLDYYRDLLDPHPRDVMQQIDPAVPCLISGHSLGGAIATLAAFDLALRLPTLRPQIQLYTYASPRVGDAAFAQTHSRHIPNSYRIVNLADTIPLVPPSSLTDVFVHIGEEWAFLSQNGDVLPNHLIETYRQAIAQSAESQSSASFPNLTIL